MRLILVGQRGADALAGGRPLCGRPSFFHRLPVLLDRIVAPVHLRQLSDPFPERLPQGERRNAVRVQAVQDGVQLPGPVEDVEVDPAIVGRAIRRQRQPQGVELRRLPVPLELRVKVLEGRPLLPARPRPEGVRENEALLPIQKAQVAERGLVAV